MADYHRLNRLMLNKAQIGIAGDLMRAAIIQCWSEDNENPLWPELMDEVQRLVERADGRMEAVINAEWGG
jgi:hypothetical protein